MTAELNDELAADVRLLMRQAIVLSAEIGDELTRAVELASEQPLSDEEARPLFTRIIALIKGALDAGLDEASRLRLMQKVSANVDEVLAHRSARRGATLRGGESDARQVAFHLELFRWNGVDVRPVAPTPVFNGQAISLTEGYVDTDRLRLWPENHRLELHLAEFKEVHKRAPTAEELVQMLHGLLPLPTARDKKKDPFGIQELAQSIGSKGVQTPPIIDWSGELKDGNRRVASCLLILNSDDFTAEQKARAAKIRVWQTPEGATEDQIDAIVVALNFERDLKIPWPEYVKARQVTDYYYQLYDSERTVVTPDRERELKRVVAARFAIKPTDVSRYLKMVRWADEFEEHHRDVRGREEAAIRYRSNELFQYFYELDAGRGEDKLGARIRQDDAFRAVVFDLMYEGKLRNWTQLRDMRKVVANQKALDLINRAHGEPDIVKAQELVTDALFEARRNDLAAKRLSMKEWATDLVGRMDEAAPALWRELEDELLIQLRRALMAAEGAIGAELFARGLPVARPERNDA